MVNVWNAEAALQEWIVKNLNLPDTNNCLQNLSQIHFYSEGDEIPIEELELTVVRAAKLVDELGVDYLAIFERAEKELHTARQNQKTLERIRCINSNLESDLLKPHSFLLKAWTKTVTGAGVFMPH